MDNGELSSSFGIGLLVAEIADELRFIVDSKSG